jgi:hypothetical protein
MDVSESAPVTDPAGRSLGEANAGRDSMRDGLERRAADDGGDRSLARGGRLRATRTDGLHGSRSRFAPHRDRHGRGAATVAEPDAVNTSDNNHHRPPHDVAMLARWLRVVSIAERAHVALSVLFKIFAVVLSVVVLLRYWDHAGRCRAPLREWVLVNLIAGLVHGAAKVATAVLSRRGQYSTTVLSFLFGLTQLFWGIWILVGVILILVFSSCRKTAPALYTTTAIISVVLLLGSQLYHIVILCLMISPAANTLRMLAAESMGDGHRVASKAEIQKLGSVLWTPDLLDDDTDSACAICLTAYDEGAELRMLPCRDASEGESSRGHYFHADCIDAWLTRQAACPICKQDIDPKRRPRQEDSQKREQLSDGTHGARDLRHSIRTGEQDDLGDIVHGRVELANETRGNPSTLMTADLRIPEAGQHGSHQSWGQTAQRHSSDPIPTEQPPHANSNVHSIIAYPAMTDTCGASTSSPREAYYEFDAAILEREPDIESGARAAFRESPSSESHPVSTP